MRNSKYRVAIIGCGSVCNFHLKGWQAVADRVEIAAICDVVPSQMEAKKQQWPGLLGGAATYTDYREMLEKEALDIACILACGDCHLEMAEACLARGLHLSMEKPVGYSLEEARRFKYLAHRYPGAASCVAQSHRYHRAYMDLRALLQSGELGDVLTGEISYSHPRLGKKESPDQSLTQQSDLAGGDTTVAKGGKDTQGLVDRAGNYVASSELTHATHPWDMVRYLFGEPREVFSTCSLFDRPELSAPTGAQMGIVWMRSGALVHVLAGITRVPSVGGMQHQFVQVHGTRGSAWLMRDLHEPYERHAYYKTDGDIEVAPQVSDIEESSHGTVIRSHNLLDCIEGKAEPINSMLDGAHTTDMLHALYLSEHMQTKIAVLPGFRTG